MTLPDLLIQDTIAFWTTISFVQKSKLFLVVHRSHLLLGEYECVHKLLLLGTSGIHWCSASSKLSSPAISKSVDLYDKIII